MKKEITVGKATKYRKVKFVPARIIAAYKDGKTISQIAQTCGYLQRYGQNRVTRVLKLPNLKSIMESCGGLHCDCMWRYRLGVRT
jgi:hypothetical protein